MHTSLAKPARAPTGAALAAEPPCPEGDRAPAEIPAVSAAAASRRSTDLVGIGLTTACAIHCLATPLIALLPVGSIFASHTAEWVLPGVAVLLALAVLHADYRKVHRRVAPGALLAVAAVLLTAGHALDEVAALGTGIALAGSVCLALAILVNLRLRRRYCACPAHAGPAAPISS
jgi:hypothetical protein